MTGASRGLGREIVAEALRRGDRVVATARNPADVADAFPDVGDHLRAVALDVTNDAQAAEAVAEALDAFGRIDVLVNNAGRALVGAIEETSDSEARAVFDINVFGLLSVVRAVLPVMRAQKSGLVINISSSGGLMGRAGFGLYCAAKFAVEGLTETMRAELGQQGILVTAVEPGSFRTTAFDPTSMMMAQDQIAAYENTAGALRSAIPERDGQQPGDPRKAATIIGDLADREEVPTRIQLGEDCFTVYGQKLEQENRERGRWRDISCSTDLDGVK